jgi:hypothetical protein
MTNKGKNKLDYLTSRALNKTYGNTQLNTELDEISDVILDEKSSDTLYEDFRNELGEILFEDKSNKDFTEKNLECVNRDEQSDHSTDLQTILRSEQDKYICPLTKHIFFRPIIAPDGYYYEEQALVEYVQTQTQEKNISEQQITNINQCDATTYGVLSPITNQYMELDVNNLVIPLLFRSEVKNYLMLCEKNNIQLLVYKEKIKMEAIIKHPDRILRASKNMITEYIENYPHHLNKFISNYNYIHHILSLVEMGIKEIFLPIILLYAETHITDRLLTNLNKYELNFDTKIKDLSDDHSGCTIGCDSSHENIISLDTFIMRHANDQIIHNYLLLRYCSVPSESLRVASVPSESLRVASVPSESLRVAPFLQEPAISDNFRNEFVLSNDYEKIQRISQIIINDDQILENIFSIKPHGYEILIAMIRRNSPYLYTLINKVDNFLNTKGSLLKPYQNILIELFSTNVVFYAFCSFSLHSFVVEHLINKIGPILGLSYINNKGYTALVYIFTLHNDQCIKAAIDLYLEYAPDFFDYQDRESNIPFYYLLLHNHKMVSYYLSKVGIFHYQLIGGSDKFELDSLESLDSLNTTPSFDFSQSIIFKARTKYQNLIPDHPKLIICKRISQIIDSVVRSFDSSIDSIDTIIFEFLNDNIFSHELYYYKDLISPGYLYENKEEFEYYYQIMSESVDHLFTHEHETLNKLQNLFLNCCQTQKDEFSDINKLATETIVDQENQEHEKLTTKLFIQSIKKIENVPTYDCNNHSLVYYLKERKLWSQLNAYINWCNKHNIFYDVPINSSQDEPSYTKLNPSQDEPSYTKLNPSQDEPSYVKLNPSQDEPSYTKLNPSQDEPSYTKLNPSQDEPSYVKLNPSQDEPMVSSNLSQSITQNIYLLDHLLLNNNNNAEDTFEEFLLLHSLGFTKMNKALYKTNPFIDLFYEFTVSDLIMKKMLCNSDYTHYANLFLGTDSFANHIYSRVLTENNEGNLELFQYLLTFSQCSIIFSQIPRIKVIPTFAKYLWMIHFNKSYLRILRIQKPEIINILIKHIIPLITNDETPYIELKNNLFLLDYLFMNSNFEIIKAYLKRKLTDVYEFYLGKGRLMMPFDFYKFNKKISDRSFKEIHSLFF